MRTVYCIQCNSKDVEYKKDLTHGCCQNQDGEIWHCNNCGEDMFIQVIYSDEEKSKNCSGQTQKCGCNLLVCDKNN